MNKDELRPVEIKIMWSTIGLKAGDIVRGWFHQYTFYADGKNSDTYALCELEDGKMVETFVTNIKFLDR